MLLFQDILIELFDKCVHIGNLSTSYVIEKGT
jgi:hypothetical protein